MNLDDDKSPTLLFCTVLGLSTKKYIMLNDSDKSWLDLSLIILNLFKLQLTFLFTIFRQYF
jgi:hypothetical protein